MVIFQYKEGRLLERVSLLKALPFSESQRPRCKYTGHQISSDESIGGFDPRGSRQMDVRACQLGSLLRRNKYSGKYPVISVIGAGGKTSTIRELAREYVAGGGQVIVMTTTHMMAEDLPWFLTEPAEDRMDGLLQKYGQVWIGNPSDNGKIQSLPAKFLPCIWKRNVPVLIEADGARRLPLKAPAEYEPVILPETTHVLSVYGLDALGKRLDEVCFRPEVAAALLKKERTQRVTEEDIAVLASSERAGKKGCPGHAGYTVVLNKADSERLKRSALEICGLLEKKGVRQVIVSSYAEEN